MDEHLRASITEVAGVGVHLLAGGDPVETFINQCRTLGVKAFVSYRLND